MSTILAYTSPARGHLFPILPTLGALAARGHTVSVHTLAEELPRVRNAGVDAFALAPQIEGRPLEDWKAKTPLGAMRAALGTWLARAEDELPDMRRAIERARPDVLLVDVNSWGALVAAEASGLPFVVFCPYFLPLELPGRPPFGMGLTPSTGWLGAARDGALRWVVRKVARPFLLGLNALRAAHGLSALVSLGELALRGSRVLYLTAEPFEYTHGGWPSHVRFVGPGLWEPASASPSEEAGGPVALVTCSTEFQNDARLIEVALEALAGSELEVVATTGAIDPARFAAPANARVVRYAPHGPLLRRAEVVVCHGGMGITQKALAAGVPVCVLPFGRDQHEVARHVRVAQAGTSVSPGASVAKVRAAIDAARTMRAGAQRIGRAFAAAGGAAAAAEVVLELASALPVP